MLCIPECHSAVYKVTVKNHVVYGPPNVTNNIGYCHVKRRKRQSVCFQAYWERVQSVCLQRQTEKTHAICFQLHSLFCSLELSKNKPLSATTNPFLYLVCPHLNPNHVHLAPLLFRTLYPTLVEAIQQELPL